MDFGPDGLGHAGLLYSNFFGSQAGELVLIGDFDRR